MPKKTRSDKRTTVSLARVVWEMAEEQMQAKGFNDNFSAYVADLIRRDKERSEEKQGQLKSGGLPTSGSRTSYPLPASEISRVEERPGAPTPATNTEDA
jgi:O-glycosyl hydrolase